MLYLYFYIQQPINKYLSSFTIPRKSGWYKSLQSIGISYQNIIFFSPKKTYLLGHSESNLLIMFTALISTTVL